MCKRIVAKVRLGLYSWLWKGMNTHAQACGILLQSCSTKQKPPCCFLEALHFDCTENILLQKELFLSCCNMMLGLLSRSSKRQKKEDLAIVEKDVVHPPGVEPGPIAWKAIILPLDQECLMKE